MIISGMAHVRRPRWQNFETEYGLSGGGSTWRQEGSYHLYHWNRGWSYFHNRPFSLTSNSSLVKNRKQNLCNFDTGAISLRNHGFEGGPHWAAHLFIAASEYINSPTQLHARHGHSPESLPSCRQQRVPWSRPLQPGRLWLNRLDLS